MAFLAEASDATLLSMASKSIILAIFEKMAYNRKSAKGRAKTYQDRQYIQTNPALDRMSYELIFQLHKHEAAGDRDAGGDIFERFARRRGDQIWQMVDALIEKHGDWLPGWLSGASKLRVA